ncbi:hypothetical protein N7535_006764 [Penicillium sp. DV-2018c]|nr:hypothetical protein N7461_007153 [Penicillium sp. DV-2018c]KAJ5567458.1 hypothetical protein N7535_006764 [Penicillium sp. DV-2018c]
MESASSEDPRNMTSKRTLEAQLTFLIYARMLGMANWRERKEHLWTGRSTLDLPGGKHYSAEVQLHHNQDQGLTGMQSTPSQVVRWVHPDRTKSGSNQD